MTSAAATLLTVLAAASSAPAAAAPNIFQETTLPTTGATPSHATAGPDGRLWVAETLNPGLLAALDWRTGTWTEYGRPNALTQPNDLAAGPDGSIWFTELGGHVARAIPATGVITEFPMPGAEPHGIAAGADGALWVAEHATSRIARVTTDGTIAAEYPTPTAAAGPDDVALGPDGNIWFTEKHAGRVARVTPDGTITEFPLPDGGRAPVGITAGPDGAMWFAEQTDPGRVARIDATTGAVTELPLPVANQRPAYVALGTDGNLWVTEGASGGAVDRVDPDDLTITRFAAGSPNGFGAGLAPTGITNGPDGNIWFVENASPGRVVRVQVAPGAKTLPATDLQPVSATLRGLVRMTSVPGTYRFEYGATDGYGEAVEGALADSEGAERQVAGAVSGLQPATTYHYRLVATNAAGATSTKDRTFTTAPAPAEVPASPAGDDLPLAGAPGPDLARPAAPRLGRSVGLAPVSGTVTVRDASGRAAVLADGATLPTGTIVDARAGTVELTTALDAAGHVQKGRFWGGVFRVHQPTGGRGMTELVLAGGSFAGCPVSNAGPRARAARAKRPPRSLWGSDDHGRFQTRGRGSVATVRGTRWYTEDRCDGTLTRVATGAVAVRDLRTKKTVIVEAGHRYLARLGR